MDPDEKWLDAEYVDGPDIICHLPTCRGERERERWAKILAPYDYMVFEEDIQHRNIEHIYKKGVCYNVENFLYAASLIKSSKLFVGNVSCWNAVAEGLKARRLIDVGSGAHNANPQDKTGIATQDFDDEKVANLIAKAMAGEEWDE